MLWVAIWAIGAVVIFINMWFGDIAPHDFVEFLVVTLIGIVFSFLLWGGLCYGGAALIGLFFSSHPVLVSEEQLIAIRDKDGVSGQFFLGSGVIKGDQYYFYYAKLPDGGFRPGKVYAGDGVRVYEDSQNGTATLKTYDWEVDNPLAYWISIPVNSGGWSYRFDVPKGTIRTGYTM